MADHETDKADGHGIADTLHDPAPTADAVELSPPTITATDRGVHMEDASTSGGGSPGNSTDGLRPPRLRKWACSRCHLANPAARNTCIKCSKRRPSMRHLSTRTKATTPDRVSLLHLCLEGNEAVDKDGDWQAQWLGVKLGNAERCADGCAHVYAHYERVKADTLVLAASGTPTKAAPSMVVISSVWDHAKMVVTDNEGEEEVTLHAADFVRWLTPLVRGTHAADGPRRPPILVVLLMCWGREFAGALSRLGIANIIIFDGKLFDKPAAAFIKSLTHRLVIGSTVADAFHAATAQVALGAAGPDFKADAERFRLNPLPSFSTEIWSQFKVDSQAAAELIRPFPAIPDARSYPAFLVRCRARQLPCPDIDQVPPTASHATDTDRIVNMVHEYVCHEDSLMLNPIGEERGGRPPLSGMWRGPGGRDSIDAESVGRESFGSHRSSMAGRPGSAGHASNSLLGGGGADSSIPTGETPSLYSSEFAGSPGVDSAGNDFLPTYKNRYALRGMLGVGKTMAAQEFVRQYAFKYRAGVLWVDATTQETIIASYRSILRAIGWDDAADMKERSMVAALFAHLSRDGDERATQRVSVAEPGSAAAASAELTPQTLEAAAKAAGDDDGARSHRRLSHMSSGGCSDSSNPDGPSLSSWLMVWDGADTLDASLEWLCPSAENGTVLITSRASESALLRFGVFVPKLVDRLSQEEAARIILTRSGWTREWIEPTPDDTGTGDASTTGSSSGTTDRSSSEGDESRGPGLCADGAAAAAGSGHGVGRSSMSERRDDAPRDQQPSTKVHSLRARAPLSLDDLWAVSRVEYDALMRLAGPEFVDGVPAAAVALGDHFAAARAGSGLGGERCRSFSAFHDSDEPVPEELIATTEIPVAIGQLTDEARDLLQQISFMKSGYPVPRAAFSRGCVLRAVAFRTPYDEELCVADHGAPRPTDVWWTTTGCIDEAMGCDGPLAQTLADAATAKVAAGRIAVLKAIETRLERVIDELCAICNVRKASHCVVDAGTGDWLRDREATAKAYETLEVPRLVLDVAKRLAEQTDVYVRAARSETPLPAAQWRAARSIARLFKATWGMSSQEPNATIQRLLHSPVALAMPHAHALVTALAGVMRNPICELDADAVPTGPCTGTLGPVVRVSDSDLLRATPPGDSAPAVIGEDWARPHASGDTDCTGTKAVVSHHNCQATALTLASCGIRASEWVVKRIGGQTDTATQLASMSFKLLRTLLTVGTQAVDHRFLAVGQARLARIFVEKGRLAKAKPLYDDHMQMVERLHPDHNHRLYAEALHRMGFLRIRHSEYREARDLCTKALAINAELLRQCEAELLQSGAQNRERQDKLNSKIAGVMRVRASALRNLGHALKECGIDTRRESVGDCGCAMDAYTSSLTLYHQVHQYGRHQDIAAGVAALAQLHFKVQDWVAAGKAYKNALVMYRELYGYGTDHTILARSMGDLGHFHLSQGRLHDARPLILGSLAMLDRLEAHHTCNGALAHRLAGKYYKAVAHNAARAGDTVSTMRNYEDALWHFREALKTESDIHGEDTTHKHMAAMHTSVGRVLMHMGPAHYVEAEEHTCIAERMWRGLFHHQSTTERRSVAFAQRDLAELFLRWDSLHRARAHAEEALTRCAKISEPIPHLLMAKLSQILGDVYVRLGGHWEVKAITSYQRAIDKYSTAGQAQDLDFEIHSVKMKLTDATKRMVSFERYWKFSHQPAGAVRMWLKIQPHAHPVALLAVFH